MLLVLFEIVFQCNTVKKFETAWPWLYFKVQDCDSMATWGGTWAVTIAGLSFQGKCGVQVDRFIRRTVFLLFLLFREGSSKRQQKNGACFAV